MKTLSFILIHFLFPYFVLAQSGTNCSVGLNNSFETPSIGPSNLSMEKSRNVANWSTTAKDSIIEIWSSGYQGLQAYEGNQFAELNANYESTLIKSFIAQAGLTQTLSFAHRGRLGIDVMKVEVGPKGGPFVDLGNFTDNNINWQSYTRTYTPMINGAYELRFVSVSSTGGDPTIGNFLDAVNPGALPVVSLISAPSNIICDNITLDGSASTSGQNIVYYWTTVDGLIISASNNKTAIISKPGTYTLKVTDSVLTCSHTSSVVISGKPIFANAGPDQTLCSKNTTTTFAANNPSNNGVWTLNSGTGSITNIKDPNSTVTMLALGDNIFVWTIPNGLCTSTDSITIHLDPIITPSFTALPDICSGSTVPGLPTTSINGVSGTWSPETVSNTNSATYTFTPNANQCALSITLTQTITPKTLSTFTALADICSGSTAPILPSTSLNGVSGTWSPATVSNTVTASYKFTPNLGQCAFEIITLKQIIYSLPVVFAGIDETVLAAIPFQLHATGGIYYTWTQGAEFLDNFNSATPKATIVNQQLFTVMARDLNNCMASDNVLIKIYADSKTFIPNSFTPNKDGLNDLFRIYYPEMKSREYFKILNRWGQVIFSTKEITKGWDGTWQGTLQPNGSYIWILKGKNENNKEVILNGKINLIR